MKLDIYQVDAFATQVFQGNPAAICPLGSWLPDVTMQNIAKENNLAETAFFVPLQDNTFHLRWFTPDREVDLCGHATLATAFTLFNCLNFKGEKITFDTLSGPLHITRKEKLLTMDFPLREATPCANFPDLDKILNMNVEATLQCGKKYVVVVNDPLALKNLKPDFAALSRYDVEALILTAKDTQYDFVSRYLKPHATLKEDPVTGSAHCILAPYWGSRLHKTSFHAYQASPRGGEMWCDIKNDRVFISGHAVLYLKGEILA
ncbi:MAG: PhzF family phenazine biosynthesis protein [Gammaproteobacteria bacterium]|nr:PhzF family phenazine biosynthesis protein [Gammaproteobacteria bacterium]